MTEFTVHLTNRPGMLAAFESGESGFVRLMVEDSVATRSVLRIAGIGFEEREILITLLSYRPGLVASIARRLADAGVNIDALYLLRSSAEGLEFADAVDQLEPARRRMAG